jgi:quercetin dioxygenase-like cupin family protein
MITQRLSQTTVTAIAISIVLALFVPLNAHAQAPGLAVKPLLRTTLSGDATKESVMVSAEFAPGATTGRHTHPGDEYTFVLQGTLEISGEGREPRRVTVGDVYHNPRGLIHEARNVGDGPARVSITFVIDKGQPITQPAAK